jgi:broad specificity phosphatase PhoE
MAGRVRGYVGRVLDSARGSDRIALVCHSGVIRVLVMHALGVPPRVHGPRLTKHGRSIEE